jgi:geranylgeranyl reductase family protein
VRVPAGSWFDLIVAGAGPAGAAAALQAIRMRPGARVLLLDKAAFPRDKPCGDGVAPHAIDELRALGAGNVTRGYRPVSRLRVRAPGGAEVVGDCARPNWVIPRAVLDARIAEAAVGAGALLQRERVRAIDEADGRVVVNGRWSAPVLIGADGANSAVRRALGIRPNRPGALAIAVRGYAPAPPGEPEQLIGWVDEGWPAYVWSFPIGDGRVNAGFGLLRSRFSGDRADLHDRLPALLPGLEIEPGSLRAHHLPLATERPRPGRGRVLLAGDAASLINPLSGEGIYYAVLSGRLAGAAAVTDPGRALATYQRTLRTELGRHLRHAAVAGRAIKARRVVEAGVGAAARSPRVFDALVELALARGGITPALAAGLARGLTSTIAV